MGRCEAALSSEKSLEVESEREKKIKRKDFDPNRVLSKKLKGEKETKERQVGRVECSKCEVVGNGASNSNRALGKEKRLERRAPTQNL